MKTQTWMGVLEKMASKTVKKNAADNEALAIHFTYFGAMLLHLDLGETLPKIRHFSLVKLDPSMTEQEKRNGFLNFISQLKTKNYPYAAISWSDGMTFRQLEMPQMPSDDLIKAIEWDLKRKYYYNPEENLIGFSEVMDVEGVEGPQKLFNIFYCEKKTALARILFVQDLGLEIRSIISSQAALGSFIDIAEPSPENDVLVCELEETLIRILVIRKNKNMLVRQVTLGPREFNLTDEILTKIAEEIKKTIDFYESQKHFRPLTKVVFAGAGEDAERIYHFMSQHIETKVVAPNLEPFLSPTLGKEDRSFVLSHGGLFVSALGSVLVQEETVNLVPEDIKTRNRERRVHRWLNLALVGTGLALLAVWGVMMINVNLMKSQLKILEKNYAEINEKKRTFEKVLEREKVRRTVFKGEMYSPSLLKELSYRTPSVITLNQMQYNRQEETLILRGRISDVKRENLKSVTQYATALAESPFFTSATVTSTNQDEESKSLQFEVTCVVKGLL